LDFHRQAYGLAVCPQEVEVQELKSLDALPKHSLNTYEAVLIAAKRARILNAKRLKENEQNPPEEGTAGGMHRIAEQALEELLQGKIEVKR
jgi:DNA-directed RNA polymerase subunit K/omega